MANKTIDNFYQLTGAPGIEGGLSQCIDWAPFQTYAQKPVGQAAPEGIVPTEDEQTYASTTLKGGNFRFMLLILGPTGSGKTAVINYLKRYATLINNVGVRAADNWVEDEVSYDHQIVRDPSYRRRFNEIVPPPRDGGGGGGGGGGGEGDGDGGGGGGGGGEGDGDGGGGGEDALHAYAEEIANNTGQIQRIGNAYTRTRIGEIPDKESVSSATMKRYKYRRKKFGFLPLRERERTGNHAPRRRMKIRQDTLNAVDLRVYANLRRSIETGRNIVFESTGKHLNTLKKIFQTLVTATNSCNTFRYIVLAAVNIIDDDENRRRIIERFKNQMVAYHHDRVNAPVPRIPNPNIETLGTNKGTIYRNLKDLIELCTTKLVPEGVDVVGDRIPEQRVYSTIGLCPGVGIDLLFIFDQNRHDWRVGEGNVGTHVQDIYPSAVIPLSKRSIYITKYTKTYNVKFHPSDRDRVTKLFRGDEDTRAIVSDPIVEGLKKKQLREKLLRKLSATRHGGRKKTIRRNKRKGTKKRRRSRRKRRKRTRRRRR